MIVARLKEFSRGIEWPKEFFLLAVGDNRWLVKDLFKLRLLLNDVPVFRENRFEIRCGQIVLEVVTNAQNLSVCLFCFVAKSLLSAGELNFSLYFLNER